MRQRRESSNVQRPVKASNICITALPISSLLFALITVFVCGIGQAASLEVYGRLPSLENICLSPDGSRIAFVRAVKNERLLAVKSLQDQTLLGGMRVGKEKVRRIEWADGDHLMIVTSKTVLSQGLRGMEQEWSQLEVYDVAKKTSTLIPDDWLLRGHGVMNVVAGDVMVRRLAGHTVLFVPGIYLDKRTKPALIRVDLETGEQTVVSKGLSPFHRWFVDSSGAVAAEQDYDDQRQRWSIWIRRNNALTEIATGEAAIEFPQVLGFGPNPDTLLTQSLANGDPVWRLLSLTDGTLGPPMAEGRLLSTPIEDRLSNRMIGGESIGDDTRYIFFDPKMQAHWDAIVRAFEGDRVRFVSASEDFTKIVVRVEGPKYGFQYEIVNLKTHKADSVGDVYEGLLEPLEVRRITYTAADSLQIPAYLTLPRGRVSKNLALIVLPHGGPAARDTADFDWWSQALADQGYAVLRPNYRGSTINQRFFAAGFGEYGRKMQSDLSDGVRYLVKEGIADPARVCIVGASYGGYAALAGVTLDPGVYRCAVSVAGLSDLKRHLNWINEKHVDSNNIAQRYLDRYMGVNGPDDPVLKKISPIDHVDSLSVPVLLIHGKNDTVVSFEQSEEMFDALRNAKKEVEFVRLENEDHWLSQSETRLRMLLATVAFLRSHNPPD